MPRRRIISAARDHLEQADALLSLAGGEVVEIRCALRHLMTTLEETRSPTMPAEVIDLSQYFRSARHEP